MHKNGTLLLRSGGNNENEDSINSSMAGGSEGGGGTEGKLISSKSLPASPLNKFESSRYGHYQG